MQFNHDNMVGAELAAALVNLDAADRWRSDCVRDTLREHRVRVPTLGEKDLAALGAWTRQLVGVFAATTPEARCIVINELLASGAGSAYLTMHDGLRPHLHFAADGQHLVSRVKALTASGLAIFTVEAGGARLGVCARPGCATVFVDTSRNGARTFCSGRCGNHEAVRRHRTRRPLA